MKRRSTVVHITPALMKKLEELSEMYGLSRQKTLEIILKEELNNVG
ncbi:hypothetical protein [Klebsiella variicola]|nr:hypothetical protein [Klebsiella variicola]